jgi:hypothetical protein
MWCHLALLFARVALPRLNRLKLIRRISIRLTIPTIADVGRQPAMGGAKVNFSKEESILHDIAAQIGADERAHVVLLRGALGSSAVAMPNMDLSALGFGFGNQNDFLRAARILEDAGVSAYATGLA